MDVLLFALILLPTFGKPRLSVYLGFQFNLSQIQLNSFFFFFFLTVIIPQGAVVVFCVVCILFVLVMDLVPGFSAPVSGGASGQARNEHQSR